MNEPKTLMITPDFTAATRTALNAVMRRQSAIFIGTAWGFREAHGTAAWNVKIGSTCVRFQQRNNIGLFLTGPEELVDAIALQFKQEIAALPG